MTQLLVEKVMTQIRQAAPLYHRLVLLVAPSGMGKTDVLQAVREHASIPFVNVNLELSKIMLELTERQRAVQLPSLFASLLDEFANDVLLLDNIEILFDPSLKQDPLRLLKGLSRNRTIVSSWNGSIEDKHLIYAEPNHVEYRRYPLEGFLIVTL
ncbi:MAG: hypothetical protein PWR18_822 [Synergistales bacterium]|nr:hypothetical protein [Synergistales bacterium]